MSSKVTYKRKIYLIDSDFQFRYLLTWLLLALGLVGGMVLATLALFFFFRGSLFRYSIEINAALAVILTGLSLYYMVRHSHRIAGPAYRLESVIRQLAQGNYDLDKKVYLRKKDYLKHIAEALNELIEVRSAEQDRLRILVAGMSELESSLSATSGLSGAVKELARSMFTEVVDMAGSAGAVHLSGCNCVTPPGLTGEQPAEDFSVTVLDQNVPESELIEEVVTPTGS